MSAIKYSHDPAYWIKLLKLNDLSVTKTAASLGIPSGTVACLTWALGISIRRLQRGDESLFPNLREIPENNGVLYDIDWSHAPIARIYGRPWSVQDDLGEKTPL